jgi:GNAT superfamily N-acetyltransferase
MDSITQIRRHGSAFSSNLFACAEQMQGWIDRRELRCIEDTGALLLFRQDRGFQRVYHAAADTDALSASFASANVASLAMAATGTAPLIADLVGLPEYIRDIVRLYSEHGFAEYERLVRMVLAGGAAGDSLCNADVATATVHEVPAISQFLEERLDPLVDRIPTACSLATAARRGEILVIWRNANPAGVLIFEDAKLSATLRYWYVDRNFQGHGIGSRLMKSFLRACSGARRIVLWVAAGNSDSIAKYRHFGFNPEALEDRIMATNHGARNH